MVKTVVINRATNRPINRPSTLLYDPKLNLNPHSCNTLFNRKNMIEKVYGRNESLDFSNLGLLYDSWTVLYNLKHFYAISVHSYIILNTLCSCAKLKFPFL